MFGLSDWLSRRRGAHFRWAHVVIPLSLLGVALWLRVANPGGVGELMRLHVFDEYQRLRPRPYQDAGVRVIDIDDETLSRIGQWPWPRTLVARLARQLHQDGAAAVVFDALFSEPDRTSPSVLAAALSDHPGLRAQLRGLPDNDAVFAREIARDRVVLGTALLNEPNAFRPQVKASIGVSGESPVDYLPPYSGAVVELPVLEKAAAGIGAISFLPEADGIIRRAPLIEALDGELVPALSMEALRVATGEHAIKIKTSSGNGEDNRGRGTGIVAVKAGPFILPTDAQGRVWVYYTKDSSVRTIPAWKILEGKVDPADLNGVIAFVGTSALGLKDMRATPLSAGEAGVHVHANIAEQAITKTFLRRPDWASGAELVFMVALGLLLLVLLPRLGALWCGVLTFAAIGGAFAFSWHAFTHWRFLLDPVFPSLAIFLVYFSSSVISYLKSESERRQVRATMVRYMAPALVEQLAKHPERLRLGGELREMTFHFCDIRGFTTISEQFDPHGLTVFINRFLTPMTDIILAHQGVIDKYMGDCIMAFWNAPLDDAEHARHACEAALVMHERLSALNADLEAEAKTAGRKFIPIHIGTGLNTGRCVVGNMGSDQRFDYSVLGDDVNLASRLEGQSKTYGVDVVIGPRTREQAPEFAALELDLIKVKGKTVPVHIFALAGRAGLAQRADFQAQALVHGRMLEAYRAKRWDEAASLIKECRRGPVALDKLYALYESRMADYRQAPPPADWDGAFAATSK